MHRVDRVLAFSTVVRIGTLRPPNILTRRRVCPTPLVPGGETLACWRGGGEGVLFRTREQTLWYSRYVLCEQMLNNVSFVYVIFSELLFVNRVWYISAGTGPCFPLAGRFAWRYVNVREYLLLRCHSLLVRHLQQAKQLLSLVNGSQPVISTKPLSLPSLMWH